MGGDKRGWVNEGGRGRVRGSRRGGGCVREGARES